MLSDAVVTKRNLEGIKRHMLICIGPSCCTAERGLEVWEYLKQRLRETGLVDDGTATVYRTKVGCLRICADGPVAVVYPEGTWYRLIDEHAIDAIITEHLVKGIPVVAHAFATSPLGPTGEPI